jgi:acyl-CoA thioesterase YciA
MVLAEDRQPAIRVSLLPRDTNPHGTIFGGVILSYIDQAGAIEAYRHGAHRVVVETAPPSSAGEGRRVTEAVITYVNVDLDGKPLPIVRS